MTASELLAMSLDPEMTPDAVRVTVYYASLGKGEHRFNRDALAGILEEGGDRRISKALGRAERCGYLERHNGGRGSDRFSVLPCRIERGEAVSQAESAGEKPVVVEDGVVKPPSPPLTVPLSEKAAGAIEDAGQKLAGCRGALRDYLQARVLEPRQYAYVQSVVSWMDNPKQVFQMADGQPVPEPDRVKLLAVALNEMAASDEGGRVAPSGDVRNVKNKLLSLSRAFGKKAGEGGARASPRNKPTDFSDVGEGTAKFNGLNG